MIRLLVVGNPEPIHVGAHLRDAAESLGIAVALCDVRAAFDASWLLRQWNWRARGHRPARLDAFNAMFLEQCRAFQPTHVLATGIAPLTRETLVELHKQDICALNFLTDDPWNPTQRADWFLDALPAYAMVFTPRHANQNDLRAQGCRRVEFMPFAYNPHAHYPDGNSADEPNVCDVLFAGGADADRVPYLGELIRSGMNVHLYGGYWERYPETRTAARGHLDLPMLRRAVKDARICLNLVRRANRDDHVMRTFEIPAMRGCMLTEDTETHRALFGTEGNSVLYFETANEMVSKAHWLLEHPDERARMAEAAHQHITKDKHTYQDRLAAMLEAVSKEQA